MAARAKCVYRNLVEKVRGAKVSDDGLKVTKNQLLEL